jgi:outer membrane usher protein
MRREQRHLKGIAELLLACSSGLLVVPSLAAETSPPPVQLAAADDALAVLAVVLNGQLKEGAAYVVRDRSDGLMVDQDTLVRLNLPHSADRVREFEGRLYVPLSSIQGLVWNILEDQQQLDIRIDPALFPAWSTQIAPPDKKLPSTPDWGGYFNYGVFASRTSGQGTDPVSGAFTASVFGPAGVGTLGALVNPAGIGADNLVVLDVNWRWDDVQSMTTTIVGDSISAPGWWGRPIRFGGIQYTSNFALQPSFISTPLLAVSGLAGLPSTTEILANNVRIGAQDVPAGPFTISNIPTVTGAGELQLVVRDAFGQQRLISQPYYVASELLRPGVSQFSFSAGAERFDYGLRNFDYGSGYAAGWYRVGFDENFTGEVRGEADNSSVTAGFGVDQLLGLIGVLSTGFSMSHANAGDGYRVLLGFDRSSPYFSFAVRSTWASDGYREIGEEGPRIRRSSSAIAQLPVGNGSFALAWTGQSYRNAAPFDIYSATYTLPVGGQIYTSISINRSLSMGTHQTSAIGIVTIPLGERTSASASVQTNRINGDQGTRAEASVQRGLPLGEGIGYYLRANSDRQNSGGFSYAGQYGRYGAEVYSTETSTSARANVTGGIAWLSDTAVFTRPIEQSFALVDMGGIAGVRVLQENNEVGRTSQNGRLMLTDVPPYSEIKVAVDPLTVPMDVTIPQNVIKIATLPRTGQVVRFQAKRERNALVRLVFPDGVPVPAGSAVTVDGRSELYPVGMDGEVYLPDVAERQTIQVRSNGKSCRLELLVPEGRDAVADIGPLTCTPTMTSARR